jgi:hypothetical protein
VAGGPLPWQWAIQAAAGTVAVLWLAAAGARALRRRCRRSIPVGRTVLSRCGLAAAVSTLTAVVALGSVALVVAVPGIVDSGFLGRLELPTAVRLVLHLPLVLTVLAACTVVMPPGGGSDSGGRARSACSTSHSPSPSLHSSHSWLPGA